MDLDEQVELIRENHLDCEAEKLYAILSPKLMGKDKLCEILMSLGYRVQRIKNHTRIAIPSPINYFNLIEGMFVVKPYLLMQTDMTNFDLKVFYTI